jgi:sulfatase modifying factor 1
MTLLRTDTEPNNRPSEDSRTRDMVRIPGGTFRMGSDHYYPEEVSPPFREVTIWAS